MKQCGRCGWQTSERYLCEICDSATIRALTLYSPLVGDLRRAMTDLHATPTDNVRVDGTAEAKLGADFDLSDRSHALYATVANWCVGWALALGKNPPEHLEGYGRTDAVTRLPGGSLEFIAAYRVSSWLIAHHDEIAEHPEAGEYAVLVIDAIAAEAKALGYRPAPKRVREKLCRACHSETLRLRWPVDGQPTLYCTACGGEWSCGPVLSRAVLQTA